MQLFLVLVGKNLRCQAAELFSGGCRVSCESLSRGVRTRSGKLDGGLIGAQLLGSEIKFGSVCPPG